MKTKLFLGMLTAAAGLAVAPAVFADDPTVDYDYSAEYQRGAIENGSFKAIHISVDGTVSDYTLTGKDGGEITNQNVYITGKGENESSLTITGTSNIDKGTHSGAYSGLYAFIVEGATVTFDDVTVSELGMNLCIGTMEDATLNIINGAQVTTGAYWSTIGSNLKTGTVNISGEGSLLDTQQINIGMATSSLSGMITDPTQDGYYYTQYLEDEEAYQKVISTITGDTYKPTDGGYGIINITEGGTWQVGVGNSDWTDNRLQFSNGEIKIDGEGSSLIFGKNSSLIMQNMDMITGVTVSETIKVTNGGSVSVVEGGALYSLDIGTIYYNSKGEATISVDGEGSTFDLSVGSSKTARIGYKEESTQGGSEDVKISATNGGEFKISAANGIRMGWTYTSAEQADSINVSFSAESGGLISLVATSNSLYFGQNTATTKAKSSVEVKASGEGSDVEIISESGVIWTNYNTSNFDTSFVAENGGTMTISASSDIVFGYGSSTAGSATVTADGGTVTMSGYDIVTNNNKSGDLSVTFTATNGGTMSLTATSSANGAEGIYLNSNSSIIVENGSTLTTSSAKTVLFESGSSISVDATSTWTTTDTVEFKAGSGIEVGAAAVEAGDGTNDVSVSVGTVNIANSASITVTIDISALGNYTDATVAILTANSIVFDYVADTDSGTTLTGENVEGFADAYITADENGYTISSWTWDDDTNTLYANIRTLPEPSMFGLLFGLSALGLVSTRRRRRKA